MKSHFKGIHLKTYDFMEILHLQRNRFEQSIGSHLSSHTIFVQQQVEVILSKNEGDGLLSSIFLFLYTHSVLNIEPFCLAFDKSRNFHTSMESCQNCLKETAVLERGILVCTNPTCNYVDYNPISYDNDVDNYEDESKQIRRYSEIETPYQNKEEGEDPINLESNFYRGKKYINDCGFSLQLSQMVTSQAESLLRHVLKILQKEKRQVSAREPEEQGKREAKGQRYRNRNVFSVRNLSGYSLFSVCFEREFYFEEYNIIGFLGIEVRNWREVIRQLNSLLRNYLEFVPICQPKHIILKICRKRNINLEEQDAMIEMCERITKYSTIDVRSPTIAAIAFWKVCQFSQKYKHRIVLSHLCRNHERLISKGKANSTFSFFDITPENVRKVYKEHIRFQFFSKYLPEWPGRIELPSNPATIDDID